MPKTIPRTHKIQILEVLGLNFRGPNGQCAIGLVQLAGNGISSFFTLHHTNLKDTG